MPCTEQRASFGDQRMVSSGLLRRHCESSFALADHIDHVNRELPRLVQPNLAVVITRNQGRVDQLCQRDWIEFHHVVRLALDWQRGTEFPAGWKMNGCREVNLI